MTNSIDRLLRDALGGRAADHPPAPCPDADIVAAFAEDTLTRDERSRVEAHVIQCVRCQAWLSALEKTRPPAPKRPWWRRRAVAWLVPVAAAATALALWIDVTRQAGLARTDVSSQAAHNDARPPEAAGAREQQQAVAKQEAQSSGATPPTAARRAESTRKPELAGSSSESDQSVRARALADSAAPTPAPPRPPSAETAAKASAEPLPSRPMTPTIAQQPAAGPRTAQRSGAAMVEARSRNTAPASSPSPVSQSLSSDAGAADRALARERSLAANSMIASADASRRWRIADGVAQHSRDGGMTWQSMATGVNVRMTAVASPSLAVCWLVGPAGTVVRSTDEGRTWQRLAFPESVDLVDVRAPDGDHAEIVTADGRTFRTADGGRTWSR